MLYDNGRVYEGSIVGNLRGMGVRLQAWGGL